MQSYSMAAQRTARRYFFGIQRVVFLWQLNRMDCLLNFHGRDGGGGLGERCAPSTANAVKNLSHSDAAISRRSPLVELRKSSKSKKQKPR